MKCVYCQMPLRSLRQISTYQEGRGPHGTASCVAGRGDTPGNRATARARAKRPEREAK